MGREEACGKTGLTIAVIVALAMSAGAFIANTPQHLNGVSGICLPSVNMWDLSAATSRIINLLLIITSTIALGALDHRYNLIPGNDVLLPATFIVAVSSIPWVSGMLTSSIILALANIVCISILFSCYDSRNATQQIFIIATILALGSMIQYAFLFMIPVYVISAIMLKCLRFREILAMLMGLVAPYWIGIGFGILRPEDFAMPSFANIFDNFSSKEGLFFGLLNIGITVLVSLVMGLQNIVKLYAGNSRRRLMTMSLNILGLVCVICMIIDFNNLTAYIASIFVVTAMTGADFFALRSLPRAPLWLSAFMLFYIGMYLAVLL